MHPKVSILVPIYGVEKYIARCARSLFNQTYPNLEFIFVNDDTKDKSIAILEEVISEYPILQDRITIINHTNNRGLAAARNTGLDVATGEYITFVDSDDYLATNAISILIDSILENCADMGVMGVMYEFSDGKRKSRYSKPIPKNNELYFQNLLSRDNHVNIWGNIFKKSIFKDNQIQFIEGLNFGEDFVTTPRIVYHCKSIVDLTNSPLYIYNQGNPNSYISKGLTKIPFDSICSSVSILTTFINTNHFSTPKKELIKRLKIRTKVYLIEYCDQSILNNALSLFPELDKEKIEMPIKHQLVWIFYRSGNIRLLRFYLWLSKHIKKYFRI